MYLELVVSVRETRTVASVASLSMLSVGAW